MPETITTSAHDRYRQVSLIIIHPLATLHDHASLDERQCRPSRTSACLNQQNCPQMQRRATSAGSMLSFATGPFRAHVPHAMNLLRTGRTRTGSVHRSSIFAAASVVLLDNNTLRPIHRRYTASRKADNSSHTLASNEYETATVLHPAASSPEAAFTQIDSHRNHSSLPFPSPTRQNAASRPLSFFLLSSKSSLSTSLGIDEAFSSASTETLSDSASASDLTSLSKTASTVMSGDDGAVLRPFGSLILNHIRDAHGPLRSRRSGSSDVFLLNGEGA